MWCRFIEIHETPGLFYCPVCEKYQHQISDTTAKRPCNKDTSLHLRVPPIITPAHERPKLPKGGVGTELKKLLLEVDLTDKLGCGCEAFAKEMDRWGIEGCRKQHLSIINKLKHSAENLKWIETLKASVRLLQEKWFNPVRPFESIVDEAIRRATEKETNDEG